jgi:XRE family transcriptional regulator, regulator of sulfur utilization
MEDLTLLVASNLKRIREQKRLSLDKLAELTGVSKSMLGQIERGESSPTIATVWKIANGLKVSFTTLLKSPQAETNVVQKSDLTPLVEDQGRYRLYPFFPIEEGRRFEIYEVEIDQGGSLTAEGHPEGTYEFILVHSGKLSVEVDNEEYRTPAGDSIRFRADRPHRYFNPDNETTRMSMVIQYFP